MQYGPILAALNTTNANKRIRIFHTRVKLRYKTTQDVASYSMAQNCHGKSINQAAKRKPHGKKNNFTLRQKEKDSRQKEKPHGKKKKTQSKKKTSRQNFFDTERTFYSYFFCREVVVILFAVRLFFLP